MNFASEESQTFHTLEFFGCKCFVLNNNQDHLEKFDAKYDEGAFLGYSTHSKTYKIFNKITLVVK